MKKNNVIEIKNLSKQYKLGVVSSGTLSHDLNRWWHKVRGKEDPYLKIGESNDRNKKGDSDYVWALKDINLEVKQGEVLGIIGKNGAGKSTLLKILSRVTGPTTGNIRYKGRIGSLLEVGTGFHPELTGRENIFLNGAILGMTKTEIKNKLDEIVEFSGCARYVDTPVKRYSSGMMVRLGFAVAAHLEPEILVVDEVLAVGDAEFQKKAIGKMQDVSRNDGRTVLFVSHNLAAVQKLCDRTIVLHEGTISFDGTATKGIEYYVRFGKNQQHVSFAELKNRCGIGQITFKDLNFIDDNNNKLTDILCGSKIKLVLFLQSRINYNPQYIRIDIGINSIMNERISWLSNSISNRKVVNGVIEFEIENLQLVPGHYNLNLHLEYYGELQDWLKNVSEFVVLPSNYYGNGRLVPEGNGYILLNYI
jgi:lipopolysaccharide transport system ATP-binding protein